MSKAQDTEVAKMQLINNRWTMVCDVIKTLIHLSVVFGLGAMFLLSLQAIVLADEKRIAALSALVKSFNLPTILSLLVGGAGVAYGALERRGKKRAVKKLGETRARLESRDAYHSSSGLNSLGEKPVIRKEE